MNTSRGVARIAVGIGLCVALACAVHAQGLPGPADVGRVKPEERLPPPDRSRDQNVTVPEAAPAPPVPEAAKTIRFTLERVGIEGASVFTPQQLRDIYAPYVGKEITLDVVYAMAAAITARYRDAGYFLSLA